MSDIVKYDDVQGYPTSSPSSLSPEDCLALSEHCINAVDNGSNLICNTALDWKRIDQQMHQMDLEFQAFSVQVDANLEMYKTRVPVISRNLDTMTRCMEKVLDKVLEMDAETDAQLDMKMKYMDMVENYMNNLSVMMAKLL